MGCLLGAGARRAHEHRTPTFPVWPGWETPSNVIFTSPLLRGPRSARVPNFTLRVYIMHIPTKPEFEPAPGSCRVTNCILRVHRGCRGESVAACVDHGEQASPCCSTYRLV